MLSTKQTCFPPALEAQAAMRNMVKQGEGFDKEDAEGKDEVAGAAEVIGREKGKQKLRSQRLMTRRMRPNRWKTLPQNHQMRMYT